MNRLFIGDAQQIDTTDTAVVRIPANIELVEQFFAIVKEQLGLPVYFGNNWDAFSESLRDLSWVPQRTVALVHQGRTFTDDHSWLTYLGVLKECIEDWGDDEEHRLVAVFPESCREELRTLNRA